MTVVLQHSLSSATISQGIHISIIINMLLMMNVRYHTVFFTCFFVFLHQFINSFFSGSCCSSTIVADWVRRLIAALSDVVQVAGAGSWHWGSGRHLWWVVLTEGWAFGPFGALLVPGRQLNTGVRETAWGDSVFGSVRHDNGWQSHGSGTRKFSRDQTAAPWCESLQQAVHVRCNLKDVAFIFRNMCFTTMSD